MDSEKVIKGRILRSRGVVVDGGYVVGGGHSGLTAELDAVVMQEAELLRAHFGTDVTIRFNSDRKSGGAWLVDSAEDKLGTNCSIGLGARLYNSQLKAIDPVAFVSLPRNEVHRLLNNPDRLCFETAINLKNTEHSVSPDSPHILLDSEYRDFDTLEAAAEYLFTHVQGLKEPLKRATLNNKIAMTPEKMQKICATHIPFDALVKNAGIFEFYENHNVSIGVSREDDPETDKDIYIFNLFIYDKSDVWHCDANGQPQYASEYINVDGAYQRTPDGSLEDATGLGRDIFTLLTDAWNEYVTSDPEYAHTTLAMTDKEPLVQRIYTASTKVNEDQSSLETKTQKDPER